MIFCESLDLDVPALRQILHAKAAARQSFSFAENVTQQATTVLGKLKSRFRASGVLAVQGVVEPLELVMKDLVSECRRPCAGSVPSPERMAQQAGD
eukprot:Skav208765  [mRNA]  locus=scaffold4352:151782:153030:- [translate_table: standard]